MKPHLPVLLRKALLACFAFTFVCSASSSAADLTLGGKDSLTIDFAAADSIPDLAGGTLQLSGDTILHLFNCGEGDGKTYTLLSGVGALLDAEGHPLTLPDENKAALLYFDTSRPGTGFWADGWLQLAPDGSVQLVLHEKEVQDALTITTRQTGNVYYSYCAGISFKNLTTTDSNGGAIYGSRSSTITLSNNGSVEFVGNTASSSGGAIYGVTITLSNNGSVEFVGNTASSSTNHAKGGAISGDMISGVSLTLSNNSSVVFEGNTASSSTNYAWGGAIYGDGDITLSNNGSVVFEGNTASSGSSSAMGAMGGAICGDGDITLSNNGSVVFVGNTASSGSSSAKGGAIYGGSSSTITLSNNGTEVFEGNTTSSGGAIRGHTITLSNNGSVEFVGNTASSTGVARGGAIDVSGESNGLIITGNASGQNEDGSAQQLLFENNHTKRTDGVGSLGAYGGAIDAGSGSTLKINNNGETIFRGNYASSTQSDAWGGAIHKQHGIFSIQNNASVVFEKNYTLQGETLRMQGIYAYDLGGSGDEMVVNFSAPKDGKIEFRDSIHIDVHSNSASAFHLNNWYENDEGAKIAQTGDIIFTGADATAENLKAILAVHGINREATADEIRLSKTYEVWGTMQLHDGRLIVRDGAVIEADGITVHGSASGESTPTLWLDNGELSSYLNSSVRKNAISISGDSALRLSGQNTAMYSTLTLSTGSTLIIDVAATHAATAALTLDNGTLTLGGGITLQLNAAEGLAADGRYMLLSGVSEPTDWANHITVSGGVWSIDNLSWVNNTLYLNYPTLTEATWNNASGDWVWNVDSSVNWEQHELNWAYRNGIGVIFGDEACGTVKLAGNLAPMSVLVNNSIGKDYVFSGTGSLTDSMKLTKEGEGNLTISTDNSYTGGTEIKGGVLVANNAQALGTGAVTLNGGTLEIGVEGITNTIANTGTSILKVADSITHTLAGIIDNRGELTFSGVFQTSGLGALSIRSAATYENAAGAIDSTGGFCKSAIQGIQLTTGTGTTVNINATIWHGADKLTLGNDGWATMGGEVSYGSYYIGTDHEVALDAIIDAAADKGISKTDITLSGGKLTANTAPTGTLSISGTSVLHGVDFNLGNAPLQNSGDLTLTGSFVADGLSKSKTWNSYVTVANEVSTDGSGFLREGDFEVTIVGGTGTVDSNGVTGMKYGSQNLIMTGGIGSGVGEMQYDTYRVLSGHTASSSAIHAYDAGKGKNALITLVNGGTLNADDAVTETKVSTTGGSINLSAGTLSGTVGGSTIVTVSGTATISGDNSYTGGTTLNSAALTVTHANALGTGGINTTGESSLSVEDVTLVLGDSIANTGELTLSGSFDASSLSKSDSADVYVDVDGNETVDGSGFTRSGDFTVTIANGTVESTGAFVSYKGTTLEMTGGVGLSKGGMLWGEYRILTGHEVELSAIVNKAAENRVSTTNIQLNGGKLTANTALIGTLSISGTSELYGVDFNLGNAPLQNSGDLTLTGSFVADGLSKSKTWNSYVTVANEVSTDGSGFLREGDFSVTVVTGSGTVDSGGVTGMKYGSQNLIMTGGIGSGVGEMQYDTYRILGGHTASSSAIHGYDEGKGQNTLITLVAGGTLNADDATTETKVSATGGSINLSAGTLGGFIGGNATVAVGGTATISGDNSYTGGTTLSNGNLTITHANALGAGSISAEGTSSLTVDNGVTLVLDEVIANAAELTLRGCIDASALQLNKTEAGRLSLIGERVGLTESGFSQGVAYSVQLVNGGKSLADGLSIHHDDFLMRTQLVLGEDGVARAGAEVDYTHYFLTGGDSAEVSKIADVSAQNKAELNGVTMDSGLLTVDQSITVSATGGSIALTKAATLSGVIEDTAVSTADGDYAAEISALMSGDSSLEVNGGKITVSGANSYTRGTTVNGGTLVAGNAQAFGTGDVTVNDATLDLNQFSITNKVLMNGSSTLGYADGASHIVLGSGAAVNFRDGYTLDSGKRLTVAGPASYTGALTLGGGTLELSGLLTVRGDVTFTDGEKTTLDVSGWSGLGDGDVLADFGSSNSGYADGCLTLGGIAGDWELDFNTMTGVLTLVAVKEDFRPNLDRNQQEVYDTMKDIMGEGKPDGLLGQLGKEVTDTRDETRLKELLDALGGAEYATLMSSQQDATRGHMRRLRGSMGSGHALAGTKTRAYIEAYTNRSDVDGDTSGRGYEMTENGGQFALEFLGVEKVNGGFAVASGRTKLQPDGGLSQKSSNTYVDAFLVHRDGGYTGKTSLGVGVHSYDLERQVMGNAVSAQADGSSVNFMHESAYEVAVDEVNSVQFFGALESSMGKLGAFHEKGAGTASLQVESQDAWMTTLSAGARYHYRFAVLEAAPAATLSLQAGLEYKLGDTESEVAMNFSGAGSHSFRQSGSKRDCFGYNVGASLHVPVSTRAAVYASGDAVLRGDSREVNANVGLQLAF